MFEPTPDEILRLFTQWEAAAAQSPNPKVANIGTSRAAYD
jgi:hypothetical protein